MASSMDMTPLINRAAGLYNRLSSAISKRNHELDRRIIQMLTMGSPFFDVLWPIIIQVADPATQNVLHLTSRYFRRLWLKVDAQNKSFIARLEFNYYFPPKRRLLLPALSPSCLHPSSLWYSWCAFNGLEFQCWHIFADFLQAARVDSEWRTADFHPRLPLRSAVFTSSASSMTIEIVYYTPPSNVTPTLDDPICSSCGRENSPGETSDETDESSSPVHLASVWRPYVRSSIISVACVGDRAASTKLEKWWMKHMDGIGSISRGYRSPKFRPGWLPPLLSPASEPDWS